MFNLFFIGSQVMMLVYNLLFYLLVKDKTYIYYSWYLFFNALYVAFVWLRADEVLRQAVLPNSAAYFDFFALATTFAMASYLLFIQSFLNLKSLLPKWNRFFNRMIQLAIPVTLIVVLILSLPQLKNIYATLVMFFYMLINVIAGFVLIHPLIKTGDKTARFFIAGLSALVIGAFLAAITRFSGGSYYIYFFEIGVLFEVALFSMGLAYKQMLIEKEGRYTLLELEKSKNEQEKEHLEAMRLKELDQFKTKFYTNITHEFRTPLTVIMGISEQIASAKWMSKLNQKEHRFLSNSINLIGRNSQNLLRLINQLLDLSKLNNNKWHLEWIQGDIVSYLQYLTESFYSAAQEKEIRLICYAEEEELIMDFDEIKLQQIIYNLLSNALKFTPKMGKIVLHIRQVVQEGQDYLQLKVKDTGQGISAQQLPHIFEQFFQAEDSKQRNYGGTGVGLSLTKELVELMGGSIQVKSQINKGTEFTILLPIQRNADKKLLFSEPTSSEWIIKPTAEKINQPVVHTSSINNFREDARVVLVIEDNRDVIAYIEGILTPHYQLEFAYNGKEGIEKALEIIPDLIISDVMMPEKDGFEVCETLKLDERSSHIPIILLTAKATYQDRLRGLQHGADAYLNKPFNKTELLIRLEKLIALRQQIQKRLSALLNTDKTINNINTIDGQFLKKIQKIVESRLNDVDLGVNDLGQKVRLSRTQVYRKLKALTGKTPSQFIRSIRLQKALKLLKTTDLNVSEVAYEVGFTDPNYFSKVFKEAFGELPSEV